MPRHSLSLVQVGTQVSATQALPAPQSPSTTQATHAEATRSHTRPSLQSWEFLHFSSGVQRLPEQRCSSPHSESSRQPTHIPCTGSQTGCSSCVQSLVSVQACFLKHWFASQ